MSSKKISDANDELDSIFEPLRIGFILITGLLGLIASARAAEHDATQPGAGQLLVRDSNNVEHSVPSLNTDVAFQINGLIAEVLVHQRFRNDGNAWLEVQYVLPLPEGAAVHDLKLHIGNRIIEGEIREKQQARAEYMTALQQGKKSSLLEQASGNLFRTAVANVAPGESVDVEIGYWQRVTYRDATFSLNFPLTYTERYAMHTNTDSSPEVTPKAEEKPLPITNDTSSIINKAAVVADAPKVSIQVDLDPGLPLLRVESPSHPLQIQQAGQHYHLSLQESRVAADRDFILTWQAKPQAAPSAAVFSEHIDNADYALVMLMPQTQLATSMPRELILVIDTSGSMEGESIRQAKAALIAALDSLEPRDRFNVIEFNSSMHALFDQAVPAITKDVQLAREWVAHLQANGGTEMYPALDKALSGMAPEGYVRQIVFATDGAVENETALFQLIETKLGNSRLFPVGIGSSPNGHFISKAAQRGRGSELLIRDLNEVGEKMNLLLTKLNHPALRDLHLNWPTGAESYPQQLPDVYLGEPLLVVARMPKLTGKLEALGWLADSDWSQSLSLDHAGTARGVARLWARNKIDSLEDTLQRGAKEDSVRAQIIEIAFAHHMVSRYTSLIAVDKTPIRPEEENTQSTQIANGIPDGQLAYAQTATPATLKLLFGALAIVLALALRTRRTPIASTKR